MNLRIKAIADTLWIMIAAFGLYFCTYAIRKPFLSGTYQNLTWLGFSYKSILILVQVMGYMLSKFIGIKVVSEIKSHQRVGLILVLLGISQVSLFLFASIKPPDNIIYIFFHGLPLGMIYSLIFSFLEGRKLTELLGIALSINLVLSSGVLKSVYFYIQSTFQISEMWLPFLIACLCTPLILLFTWMLYKSPKPTKEDVAARLERSPMTANSRNEIIRKYSFGLICLAILYMFFTGLRDFRDNFSIEIWHELNAVPLEYSMFAKYETQIAVVVMLIIGFLVIVKGNKAAYRINTALILISLATLLFYSLKFYSNEISYKTWYIYSGIALFLPYLIIQVAFFDRLFALLKIKGNVGFLIYICDASGYLLSVIIMFGKEFFFKNSGISFIKILLNASILFSILGLILILFQFVFFEKEIKKYFGVPRLETV
jgi:Family of unknown function (DUF5690)